MVGFDNTPGDARSETFGAGLCKLNRAIGMSIARFFLTVRQSVPTVI